MKLELFVHIIRNKMPALAYVSFYYSLIISQDKPNVNFSFYG